MNRRPIVTAVLAAVLILLVAGSALAAEGFRRSHALVIGISDYARPEWPDLTFPEKDARAMEAFLRGQGFEVTALYNGQATRSAIITALEEELPHRIGAGDRVVLFYSGHGHTRSFANVDYGYLVPHDAGRGTGSMIAMDTLNTWSQKIAAARHQLFLMDACFGGLLAPKASAMPSISPDHPDYITEIARRDARQYLTAGGRDQQVLDGGPKGYSYFTGYLLEALQDGFGDLDGDGYITASELTSYLIPRATNRYQTPGAGTLPGHGLGDFVFRAPGGAAARRTADAGLGDEATKGAPQTAALPPADVQADDDAPAKAQPDTGPATSGPTVGELVQARSDQTRDAMQRLLRQTGYGKLATASVRQVKLVRVLADGPARARLELRYYAVNMRTRDSLTDTVIVDARLDDDRLVFEAER